MKKVLALLAALLITPLSTLAVSLYDIQNNPDQYVLVAKNDIGDYYVDSYSIASLRYDPPYYAMRCDIYTVSYSMSGISKYTLTATYNYNRCLKSLIKTEHQAHPNASKKYLYSLVWNDLQTDNGLTGCLGSCDVWDLDGTFLGSLTSSEVYSLSEMYGIEITPVCHLGTPKYHAANYMFYKGYNEYFQPKFDSKYLY